MKLQLSFYAYDDDPGGLSDVAMASSSGSGNYWIAAYGRRDKNQHSTEVTLHVNRQQAGQIVRTLAPYVGATMIENDLAEKLLLGKLILNTLAKIPAILDVQNRTATITVNRDIFNKLREVAASLAPPADETAPVAVDPAWNADAD